MINIYGIPNCDTVKKTKKYFELNNIDYHFINFKKTPPTKSLLKSCEKFLGELPVNKRGTTFRKFKEDYLGSSASGKIDLLIKESSMIKRPIIEKDGSIYHIGHDESKISELV